MHVAIICTTERLPLRDDDGAGLVSFNVNLSTAIVQEGATADQVYTFVNGNTSLLEMWHQSLALDKNGNCLFDVFVIGAGGAIRQTIGTAAAAGGANAQCSGFLETRLGNLMTQSKKDLDAGLSTDQDVAALVWDPANPAGSTGPSASTYRQAGWKETVAHASTWVRPLPQGLNLSFEVAVTGLAKSDQAMIFPRFASSAVNTVTPVASASAVWNSYRGQYQSASTNAPPVNVPLVGYHAPCAVAVADHYGLVNTGTLWVEKDPMAATESTSNWRQSLEASIASRFDYLPRLLPLLEQNFAPGTSDANAKLVWNLGMRMLQDLSDYGQGDSLEGSSLQYALLLRAVEGPSGLADAVAVASEFVGLLNSGKGAADWQNQVSKMLQLVDADLAALVSPTPPPTPSPRSTLTNDKVIPTVKRLYAALAKDANLAALLDAWWNSSITAAASAAQAQSWTQFAASLENDVLPPAQLHKRYLSAIADRAVPPPGVQSPTLMAALGTPFAGRINHTASLLGSMSQMLVFGGSSQAGPPQPATLVNDVWTLGVDNAATQPWTQITPGGTLPAARSAHSAVFGDDAFLRQLLVFGGSTGAAYVNDLYALVFPDSGNPKWRQLILAGAPAPRSGHTAVYDPGKPGAHPTDPPAQPASMIVFGGDAGTPTAANPNAEVWLLLNSNLDASRAWKQLTPAGGPIPARMGHSAIYDAGSNRMIVFGGNTGTNGLANDVWILANANGTGAAAVWSPLAPTGKPPDPRCNHSAVYDPASNSMIVFGGRTAAGDVSETWLLSNANGMGGASSWAQLSPSGQIGKRSGHTAVFDGSGDVGRMIVFSGGANPIADVIELSNPLSKPEWDRLNPSGHPQLDSAVSACIRGWVHASAVAAGWAGAQLQQLDDLVTGDVNDPQTGLDTVADDAIVPTQRPHSVVLQVGAWNSSDQEDPDEDLRHVAGIALLIRKLNGTAALPWRCPNAADVTVTLDGVPAPALTNKIVPSRMQYRNGGKDPFLDYDNHSKIAPSPAVKLSGNFGETKPRNAVTTPGLFSYKLASGVYARFYGLVFGSTYQFAPFAVGHGGAMPMEIEQALANSTEIMFDNPAVIRTVEYYRRVPVGHLRTLPGTLSPDWQATPDVKWPVIPANVYPLTRDLGLLGDNTKSVGSNAPLLLLQLNAGVQPNNFIASVQQFKFNVQAPAVDINTWDRWVADGSTYPASGTTDNTTNTRKALWAAFHREAGESLDPDSVANNRIGDPSVTALQFRLEQYSPSTGWTDAGSGVVPVSYKAASSAKAGSDEAWAAVYPAPVLVTVQATNGAAAFAKAANGSGFAISVSVPLGGIVRLTSRPLVLQTDFAKRFEPGIFTAEAVTDSGIKYVSVGVDYGNLGTDQASFQAMSILIECPTNEVIHPDFYFEPVQGSSFTPRILTPTVDKLESLLSIGEFEWRRQDWRWMGRPLPPYPPLTPWAATTSYLRGDSIGDPAGNRHRCIQSGTSGEAEPAWIPGMKIQDGSVLWSDEGKWTHVEWEDHAFLGRPEAVDFHSGETRFNLTGAKPATVPPTPANPLPLTSFDLSGDLRCQYIRFDVLGHNRYENMPYFKPVTQPQLTSRSYIVPRGAMSALPPKPLVRLVLPIAQRSPLDLLPNAAPSGNVLGSVQTQRSTFDLLVIGDESWYRIGGLGESLVAEIEPVLGARIVTVLFTGSPPKQVDIAIDQFGGYNGVTYLDTNTPLTLSASGDPPARGEYSFTLDATNKQIAHYLFSPDDAGTNVAISYLQLDANQLQRYQYGVDQLVDSSAAAATVPTIRMEPMGATLDDPRLAAPVFTNTYFRGTVENDEGGLTNWHQFKVRFRRELQPFGGTATPAMVSAWTDSMWVETLPDSATFLNAAGEPVPCAAIKASWTLVAGAASPTWEIDVSPALAPSGSGARGSGMFELWYVVTQQIADAGGQPAEVYVPPAGGTGTQPVFTPRSGSYNLRIVEVQKSPKALPPLFKDDGLLENSLMTDAGKDELARIVRISPPLSISAAS